MLRDIRLRKDALRTKSRTYRLALEPAQKERWDLEICRRLLALQQYKKCDTLFVYVSKPPLEVGTEMLIQAAWSAGKKVAVPRCVPGTREMVFYEITTPRDLEAGTFGVGEPRVGRCRPAAAAPQSFCVVPGLCFDDSGYRLGYGKGYYDRFLARFPGKTAGICYCQCVYRNLPHGRFDRPVGWIITEKYTRRTARVR